MRKSIILLLPLFLFQTIDADAQKDAERTIAKLKADKDLST